MSSPLEAMHCIRTIKSARSNALHRNNHAEGFLWEVISMKRSNRIQHTILHEFLKEASGICENDAGSETISAPMVGMHASRTQSGFTLSVGPPANFRTRCEQCLGLEKCTGQATMLSCLRVCKIRTSREPLGG